jgi:YVTN family beta-propeller protein
MAYQGVAIGKTAAAIAVVVLVTVAAIGIVLLVPHVTTNSATSTPTVVSTQTLVSTGPVPSVSDVEIANVTVARTPFFIPGGMAIDSKTNTIYVADGTDNLTVVDASTHTAIDTITLPGSPVQGWGPIAIDSETNVIYVSTWGCTNEANVSNSCQGYSSLPAWGIVEIDGQNNKIVGKIPVSVDLLTVDSSTGILYGTNGSNLLAIDEHSGSIMDNLSLHASLQSIAVDAKAGMVYVAACKQSSLGCMGGEVL